MDTPDERRAKARERMRMRRARETPAEADDRRRRNRERMRIRRAAVPETLAVPVRQIDPDPSRFRIDPHTLMPVYEDKCPLAAARRIMGMP